MQVRFQQPLPPTVESHGGGAHGGVAVAEPPPRAAPPRKPVTARRARRARPRLYVIDGIRLVAALMVALHHYAGTNRANQPGNAIWDRPASEIMPSLFRFASFGWIGVEIFFVISGFVICMSCWGRTPKDFFVSRVIRLYPAYWVGVAFTTASMIALPGVWERPPGRDILLNFTMLQSGSNVPDVDLVYWTLWSELRFYLLFMVVVAMGLTYRRVVVFCCVWGAAAMLAPVSKFPLLVLAADPSGAWYFIAGLALYLMHRFGQDLLLWGILAMAWLMGQRELALRVAYEDVSSWRGAVLIFTVFLLVMVAVALGYTDRIRWKWLVTAGCLTYPLYLMHYVAGVSLISRLHDTMDPRLLLALVISGFLALSWLVHRFVERPAARLLKRGLESSFTRLRTFGRAA
ncbi:acyltransferase [Streptomyces sp. Rer75]|uniref:acyltransferase family protein n=1 Tax=unclassified Streptomyces TaxID=2593676 RepID=UPI0015D0CA06|nr:acyltransferase [Streptomyces sp. Rer75]QLH22573.1 acyltransferase [Streptomyces sp. Rer75]